MNNNNGSDAIQVMVVAPAMLAWGLERLFQQARFALLGSATTVAEAAPQLQRLEPHVVVLDLDGADPLQAIGELKALTQAAIVALTSSHDTQVVDQAVVAGARGVVRKSDPPPSLLKAVERVKAGELWIDRSAAGRIFMELARQQARRASDPERLKIESLTTREREMIAAVTSDAAAPGKVIARRLSISEHTLRNHLSSVYGKLGLANRVDLYAYATKHHLNQQA